MLEAFMIFTKCLLEFTFLSLVCGMCLFVLFFGASIVIGIIAAVISLFFEGRF